MAKLHQGMNGTVWKIVAILTALGVAGVGWVVSGTWNAASMSQEVMQHHDEIALMKPQIETNKVACQEFRYKIDRLDEKLTEQSRRQTDMLAMQQEILNEIKKRPRTQ